MYDKLLSKKKKKEKRKKKIKKKNYWIEKINIMKIIKIVRASKK